MKKMNWNALGAMWMVVALTSSSCYPVAVWTDGEVPFVPTPLHVVDRMLEMARVTSGDVIYDLGSGDGRIVVRAAQKFGARGIGIEVDAGLVQKARDLAFREKVDHLVEFRVQDALTVDISPATVVTLYMLPEFNAKLRPIFEKQLKAGTRVVAHDYGIEGWVPDRVERIKRTVFHDHTILLFEVR
jgi:cyclopropane fatty-acyl-phospholipid synthase-like methyltransferase